MKIITVDNKEYKLVFLYEAAEYKDFVQKMFNVRSGAYLVSEASDVEEPTARDLIKGSI